jgi:hypothetical protein
MKSLPEVIADNEAYREALSRIVNPSCSTLDSHDRIVTYSNCTTSYAFDVADKITTNPRVARASRCNRFTEADAITVTAICTSPSGSALVARHYREVCAEELVIIDSILEMLSKAVALAPPTTIRKDRTCLYAK